MDMRLRLAVHVGRAMDSCVYDRASLDVFLTDGFGEGMPFRFRKVAGYRNLNLASDLGIFPLLALLDTIPQFGTVICPADDAARDLANLFEGAEPTADRFVSEWEKFQAEQEADARIRAEEFEDLDREELGADRVADKLPKVLGDYLRAMTGPRRKERQEAILKKVGWEGISLVGLNPAALAVLAENRAERHAKAFPCQDEDGNLINGEADHRKRRTAKWWRRRLRREQSHALLYVEAAVGAVGGPNVPGRPLYVSDYSADLHRQHEERTQEILGDLWLVREDDPSVKISMADVDRRAREAKATERRMLIDMNLRRWEALGWSICWITITLPGQYVCHSTNEDRRVAEWDPDLGPLEAMAAIQEDFHWTMCLLRERGIRPCGWWNSQPQQSGTPHRHIILALPTQADARAVCDAFREKFGTRRGEEDGPDRGCAAFVIGDNNPKYKPRKSKDGSTETAASVAKYAARYSTRQETGKSGDGDADGAADGHDEQNHFNAWKSPRRARGHTWLGLDSQRSPIELWRTLWSNAQRSDYQPDDARMALAMTHMRSAKAFVEIAQQARANADTFARGDEDREAELATARRAATDAATEAWHAAIAVGMWPDADLDPVESEWLLGETGKRFESMDIADPLPPVPLRENRESVFGETRSVFIGAIGTVERFRVSGRPSRAELFEAAETVGVHVERPRAKLRRKHVLDSIEASGFPVTWREKKLTLQQLLDLADRLRVTVDVPIVDPTTGAAFQALKAAGFGFCLTGIVLRQALEKWSIKHMHICPSPRGHPCRDSLRLSIDDYSDEGRYGWEGETMTVNLPDGDYPFIDQRLPLSEMSMIEVPPDLEALLKDQATKNGISIVRNEPVEFRCQTKEFGDACFLIYWPEGQRMHMLAPKGFQTGRA